MNLTSKKLLILITAMLAGVALVTSCSKESGVQGSKQQKGKEKGPSKERMTVFSPAEKTTFKVVRNGQHATLDWSLSATGGKCERIHILRNLTGTDKNKRWVAVLTPDTTKFTDEMPDEHAYWYWLRLFGKDNKFQEIGPVRVVPDMAGPTAYAKREDKYKATISRTDDLAVIKWDFAGDEYKTIEIARYPRAVTEPFRGNNEGSVLVSMEKKSQYTDSLPNPYSEYWYWFRITLKSGAIHYKGPIKADYVRR